jgi:hypothetical protein
VTNLVKLIVYVPPESEEKVRLALGAAGAGHIGKYDYCAFVTKGVGHYRPLAGTKPYKGIIGTIEAADELKIETVCEEKNLPKILTAMRRAHPYEEIAYDIVPLRNDEFGTLVEKRPDSE